MTAEPATRRYYLPEGLPAPAPAPDGLGAEYWEAARRHELMVQRCNACRTFQWGPEWICHNCHSFDLGYEGVEARGRIFSWERCWYPVHPKLADGVPYVVVLVELPQAGNVRMVGNLIGDPRQEVPIGAEVEAVFEDHDAAEPFTLIHWRLT
ncbi:MAG: Zn-ribbon domain-containing OB-fold protein [Tepidiformaceae bacterium]